MPPSTPAAFCLYLPSNYRDAAYYALHLLILLFIPSPRCFQWRVMPLTDCTTSFRLWQRCWCLTTIEALKPFGREQVGEWSFSLLLCQLFNSKLNVPFPTSAESLSGYVNHVWKETASFKETIRVSRSHLLCSGFPGPPEPFRLSWFEFELTACSRRSTGRENPVLGNDDQSAKGQS